MKLSQVCYAMNNGGMKWLYVTNNRFCTFPLSFPLSLIVRFWYELVTKTYKYTCTCMRQMSLGNMLMNMHTWLTSWICSALFMSKYIHTCIHIIYTLFYTSLFSFSLSSRSPVIHPCCSCILFHGPTSTVWSQPVKDSSHHPPLSRSYCHRPRTFPVSFIFQLTQSSHIFPLCAYLLLYWFIVIRGRFEVCGFKALCLDVATFNDFKDVSPMLFAILTAIFFCYFTWGRVKCFKI